MPSNHSLKIKYSSGLHISDTILWLDTHHKGDLCFLSHQHFTKKLKGNRILTTSMTLQLSGKPSSYYQSHLTASYFRPFNLGSYAVELFPAGHIPGSAQLNFSQNEQTLLYTGHLNLSPSPTCKPGHIPKQVDILILDSTNGSSKLKIGQGNDIYRHIKQAVEKLQRAGKYPIILSDRLGISQNIIKAWQEFDFTFSLHPSIYKYCRAYQKAGIPLKNIKRLNYSDPFKGPLQQLSIIPADLLTSPILQKAKNIGTILVTEPQNPLFQPNNSTFDYQFSLSLHTGYKDLLKYIDQVRPKKVYTFSTLATEFSTIIKKKFNIDSSPLQKPVQLQLPNLVPSSA